MKILNYLPGSTTQPRGCAKRKSMYKRREEIEKKNKRFSMIFKINKKNK